MTIDETIERLELVKVGWSNADERGVHTAIQLGIEALKEYKRLRALKFSPSSVPLRGETEE